MRLSFLTIIAVAFVPAIDVHAQNRYPSVATIMQKHDADQDGRLTAEEVAGSQYARQFSRWDGDQDGAVSREDIVRFRRRFGIAADGSMLANSTLEIPDVKDLPRVDREHRPTAQAARQSAYILKTEAHPTAGEQYFILTDHQVDGYLEPLRRLAAHRKGQLIQVKDLSSLIHTKDAFLDLRKRLADARYVAIAMRKDSFRENTLLAMWEMLSTLDDDPQVDVWPGLLLASDEAAFSRLIDQSIAHQPLKKDALKPFAISQVQRASETRSLQKAGVLRKMFAESGLETSIVAIYGRQANDAPKLQGTRVWNLIPTEKQKFVKQFPEPVSQALNKSALWILHGHGIPGMSCSVDIDAMPENLSGKILLSGSCFSAAPWHSDLPNLREAPGGYQMEHRDAFVIRAVDKGAVVAFGHQRLSSGFPHLFPVLKDWLEGQTVGQAYQQLLNGLIDLQQTKPGDFVIAEDKQARKQLPQNVLLYVVIGDPALIPMESLK